MVYLNRSQIVIQTCHDGLNAFGGVVSNTESLERLLKMVYKALEFYRKARGTAVAVGGLASVALQIKDSVEILAVAQLVTLLQELLCPNAKGRYFFAHVSWQKGTSRIFLLFYSVFTLVRLAEKFEFIHICKATVGPFPMLNLMAESSYALYCLFSSCESVRTKVWLKAAASTGKIFVVVFGWALQVGNIQSSPCTLTLLAIGFVADGMGLFSGTSSTMTYRSGYLAKKSSLFDQVEEPAI